MPTPKKAVRTAKAPAQQRSARLEPKPVPPKPAPAEPKAKPAPPKVARAEPPPRSVTAPPAAATTPGLSRRSTILFAADTTDPAQTALGAIKFLASDLNAAMTGPGSRIELKAYGGARGDKSSDAHRLALKRALSIRQILIDDGVATDRIDVQAAGGVDDDGPTDRVDVYIKA
jgi:outer membrane protein OmpA-like peptidoglycan-associated protein